MVFPFGQIAQQGVVPGVERSYRSDVESVPELCIIGDGANALALSHLVAADRVVMFADGVIVRRPGFDELDVREFEVRERGASVCSHRGNSRSDLVSSIDPDIIKSADGIVVAIPSTKYGALIERLSGSFSDGQTICLVDAPLGASLEFRHLLRKLGCDRELNVLEAGKLFDKARIDSGILLISGVRERISVCGVGRNETRRGLGVAQAILGKLVPTSNVIERGLTDVERIIRPVLLLSAFMSGQPGKILEPVDSLSPSVIRMLVAMEREVQMLARSFDSVVPTFVRSLNDYALASKKLPRPESIEAAVTTLGPALFAEVGAGEDGAKLAQLLASDICETLTLIVDLGLLSRSPVGFTASVIEFASVIAGSSLEDKGRKASSLGLVGFDSAEIVDLINS